MTKRNRDLASAATLAVLAIALNVDAQSITMRFKTAVDSGFFPELVTGLLFIVALIIGIQALRRPATPDAADDAPATQAYRVWGTLVLVAAFILLMPVLGFPIAAILFLLAQMYLLTPPGEHDLKRMILVSVPLALAVYFIFTLGFGLILPHSPF